MTKLSSLFTVLVLSFLSSKSRAFQHVSLSESKILTQEAVLSGWRQQRLLLPSFSRISHSPSTASRLSSSPNGANTPDRPSRGGPSRGPDRIRRLIRRIINFQARFVARFRALPAKAKRVFVVQWMIVFLIFGAVAKNTVIRPTPTPIEISYSKFLHLIEQQQNAKDVPVMDHVRIGTDRIIYRLYPATSSPTNAPGKAEKIDTIKPAENSLRVLARSRSRPKPAATTKKLGAAAAAAAARPYVTAYTRKVAAPPELVSALHKSDIHFAAASQARASTFAMILRGAVASFYFLILWRLYRSVSNAGGGGGKGEVPGKLAKASDLPLANFDEIEGIDEVKAEVMELVDTIRHPEKYAILGARAPTGILLEGPSGTGKTMLARATAATAGVPLIYCSGSDFVEMFVGRGAARVRKLFEKAAKLAPCIIFIDELDALGKARDSTIGGMSFSRSNDEAEQTLNQLLACMDGLDSTRGISVLAATNRKEILDPALVRPGRFDRIVQVKLPDAAGREKILRVHCKKLPGFTEGSGVDPDRPGALGKGRLVDLAAIAAVTDGLSGAELEFLVNEAAIRAVRRVSRALHNGGAAARDIVPHVEAVDFEASVANYYATRRPKGAANLFKNVWK